MRGDDERVCGARAEEALEPGQTLSPFLVRFRRSKRQSCPASCRGPPRAVDLPIGGLCGAYGPRIKTLSWEQTSHILKLKRPMR